MKLDTNPSGVRTKDYASARECLYHPDFIQGQKEFEPGNVLENVVMQLHGEEHKTRRRRENPLFREAVLESFETDKLPEVIDTLLDPLVQAGGSENILNFGYDVSLVASARFAGIDYDWRDAATRRELIELDKLFMQGALLPETREELLVSRLAEIQRAMREFDAKFLSHSRARREKLIADNACGVGTEEVPVDLLTALLEHRDELGLDDGIILRETAFFLESGGQTSVQLIANTLDVLLRVENVDIKIRCATDIGYLQRCVIEVQRLFPQNPAIRRRALTEAEIAGCPIGSGELVLVDLNAANHDKAVWGDDAANFNPDRVAPRGVTPWGLSFSGGVHTCIGRTMAVGPLENLTADEGAKRSQRMYGIVPRIVQALLKADIRLDDSSEPTFDASVHRRKWATMPVKFGPST